MLMLLSSTWSQCHEHVPPIDPAPSFSEIEGYLSAIGPQLFEQAASLWPKQPARVGPLHLQRVHVSTGDLAGASFAQWPAGDQPCQTRLILGKPQPLRIQREPP